jgi:8-oxo-dGTP pyrophosphatase MutT (NUDIX family)
MLEGYRPRGEPEDADVTRIRDLLGSVDDPFSREIPLHVTGSAVIVHGSAVLLRWHQRQQAWLQVGGHGDPGETDPLHIALREGREETGLSDLTPVGGLLHAVIVPVPAKGAEPAHEHADLRYVLATARPEEARPEKPTAPLKWLPLDEAIEAVSEDNLRETLRRVRERL